MWEITQPINPKITDYLKTQAQINLGADLLLRIFDFFEAYRELPPHAKNYIYLRFLGQSVGGSLQPIENQIPPRLWEIIRRDFYILRLGQHLTKLSEDYPINDEKAQKFMTYVQSIGIPLEFVIGPYRLLRVGGGSLQKQFLINASPNIQIDNQNLRDFYKYCKLKLTHGDGGCLYPRLHNNDVLIQRFKQISTLQQRIEYFLNLYLGDLVGTNSRLFAKVAGVLDTCLINTLKCNTETYNQFHNHLINSLRVQIYDLDITPVLREIIAEFRPKAIGEEPPPLQFKSAGVLPLLIHFHYFHRNKDRFDNIQEVNKFFKQNPATYDQLFQTTAGVIHSTYKLITQFVAYLKTQLQKSLADNSKIQTYAKRHNLDPKEFVVIATFNKLDKTAGVLPNTPALAQISTDYFIPIQLSHLAHIKPIHNGFIPFPL